MASGEFRLRVRYGKVGRLRWLSHLEVVRALERAVRRAELPFALSQGFSPHIRIAFGPALPVGTAGQNEYYDVWLTRYTGAEDALQRLGASTPEDLAPSQARFVGEREPSLAAATNVAVYRVAVDGKESSTEQVRAALSRVVESGSLTVERKGKHKVFDLTRSLLEETRVTGRDSGCDVHLTVRIGPEGSLRPETLVSSALVAASLDASVTHTTRTDTLIETEGGTWARPL